MPSRRIAAPAPRRPRVAVVGAGVAGSACAQQLAAHGCEVTVFDKSRGVGGRLATRRAEWVDNLGRSLPACFDHGAAGFSARTPAFQRWLEQGERERWMVRWAPVLAPDSFVSLDQVVMWLPTPDMPSLCKHLLGDLPLRLGQAVDGLSRSAAGWSLSAAGEALDAGYDHLVLAIPPAQAAPLLRSLRSDWAVRAAHTQMRPCWSLMAVTEPTPDPVAWQASWPRWGALAWVGRNDSKPGRCAPRGRPHWVAHATADWSQTQLEAAPEQVLATMKALLCEAVGQPLEFRQACVHRWRYATAPRGPVSGRPPFWWDASLGLGVCGDHLGGAGVEGAWLSGQALAAALLADQGVQPAVA